MKRIKQFFRAVRNNFALGLHNGIEIWGERASCKSLCDLAYRLGHAIGTRLTETALAEGCLRPPNAPPLDAKEGRTMRVIDAIMEKDHPALARR